MRVAETAVVRRLGELPRAFYVTQLGQIEDLQPMVDTLVPDESVVLVDLHTLNVRYQPRVRWQHAEVFRVEWVRDLHEGGATLCPGREQLPAGHRVVPAPEVCAHR